MRNLAPSYRRSLSEKKISRPNLSAPPPPPDVFLPAPTPHSWQKKPYSQNFAFSMMNFIFHLCLFLKVFVKTKLLSKNEKNLKFILRTAVSIMTF
jgi:hypothetical protein